MEREERGIKFRIPVSGRAKLEMHAKKTQMNGAQKRKRERNYPTHDRHTVIYYLPLVIKTWSLLRWARLNVLP